MTTYPVFGQSLRVSTSIQETKNKGQDERNQRRECFTHCLILLMCADLAPPNGEQREFKDRHDPDAEHDHECPEDRLVDEGLAHRSTTLPSIFFLNLESRDPGKRERLRMPRCLSATRFAFAIIGTSIFCVFLP